MVLRCVHHAFYMRQVICFYFIHMYGGIILLFFYTFRLHHNNNSSISERFWKIAIIATCIIIAVLVTYSRVYLLYHTISQVLWGAFVGTILGTIWFIIAHIVLTPIFPIIASWYVNVSAIKCRTTRSLYNTALCFQADIRVSTVTRHNINS